jgi:hypothetical protein
MLRSWIRLETDAAGLWRQELIAAGDPPKKGHSNWLSCNAIVNVMGFYVLALRGGGDVHALQLILHRRLYSGSSWAAVYHTPKWRALGSLIAGSYSGRVDATACDCASSCMHAQTTMSYDSVIGS